MIKVKTRQFCTNVTSLKTFRTTLPQKIQWDTMKSSQSTRVLIPSTSYPQQRHIVACHGCLCLQCVPTIKVPIFVASTKSDEFKHCQPVILSNAATQHAMAAFVSRVYNKSVLPKHQGTNTVDQLSSATPHRSMPWLPLSPVCSNHKGAD